MGGPEAALRRAGGASVERLWDFRSLTPSLRAARVCLGIAVLAAVLDGVLSLFATAVTGWAIGFDPAGGSAQIDAADLPAGVRDLVAVVAGSAAASWALLALAVLVAGISLIRWQTNALRNMRALGQLPRWPPEAAGLAWFVPVWSLFAPKQTFDDLWRSSSPVTPGAPAASQPDAVRVPWFHTLWWGLWTGAWVLAGVGAVRMSRSPTLAGMLLQQLNQVLVAAALAGAGLLLLRILRLTTTRQHARYAERAGTLGWHPDPPGTDLRR